MTDQPTSEAPSSSSSSSYWVAPRPLYCRRCGYEVGGIYESRACFCPAGPLLERQGDAPPREDRP